MPRSFSHNSCFVLFALWAAFFPPLSLPAQALYKMRHLGPTDGLSYRWVYDIAQDSLGHIWVGTSDGLNRYDGHRFSVFRTEVTGTLDPIALNHFKWVFCMAGNDIWLTAMEGTHLHFISKNSQLQPFAMTDRGQPADARPLMEVQTGRWWALVRMKEGEMEWLGRVTSPGHFQPIVQLEEATGIEKYVVALPGGERFWAYEDKAYYIVDLSAPSVVKHAYSAIPGASIAHPSLPIDAQRRFWFPAPEGGFRHFVLPAAVPIGQWERFVLDNKGNFWIWTRGKHTWRYAAKKDALEDFGVFDFWEYNLYSPLEDREGNIWLPHFYGLTQLVPQRRLFENYLNKPLNDLGVALGGTSLYALWEGDDGSIYINTLRNDATVRLKPGSNAPEFLPWLPPFWEAAEKAAVEQAAARLRLDTMDRYSRMLWLHDKENQALWIGPRQATGIHRIDLRSGEDRAFQLSEAPLSLKQLRFLNGQLWVASTSGLYRLGPQNGQCHRFSTKDGLPHNVVYSILTDGPYLWLGTHYGLCRFDTHSGETKNYYVEDGLTHNEFNSYSALKTRAGKMYFGGLNGLNAFFPADIEQAELRDKPRLYLNGFAKFDGQRDTLTEQPCPSDSSRSLIRLHPDDRSFVFDFSINSFYNPSQNKYLYYLDGLEKPWCNETNEGRATYLYLPPGHYVLRVKAAGPFGNWAANEIAVPIEMPYRWYMRWWAWCAYALVLWFGGRWLYRLRLSRHLEHREALRLRELDEFKSRLFTNITHEFRTPLTVILGVAEQMEQAAPDSQFSDLPAANRFSEGLKKRLALVRRNGRNLLDLVNQLLDLAKAESNQLKVSLVQGDLVRYVRYITESSHSVANHHNILLRVESQVPELLMDYDPEKIRQILSNLLSNALKHTPSGGRVTVSIAHQAAVVWLKVEDTGTGIAPDELPRIFDRFYQANSSVAQVGGTGIGLALTKELVKLLGGSVSVESPAPGGSKGTVFTVQLPIKNEAGRVNPTPDPSPKWEGGLSVHRDVVGDISSPLQFGGGVDMADSSFIIHHSSLPSLLILEDNPDVVEYLKLCLEGRFQLDFAYNGRAGIEKGLDTVPDLILSDVMMPENDGFEVCDALKNDERTSHIPIVLLTAKADVESRIAGLRRGADAYLAKPFHPDELLATLQNLLVLRQKLQAKYASAAFQMP
ncbi:MAG: ATP-binding protein, partial [Saprospiraceae bacterium]